MDIPIQDNVEYTREENKSNMEALSSDEAYVVDWDGPEDPENPKK